MEAEASSSDDSAISETVKTEVTLFLAVNTRRKEPYQIWNHSKANILIHLISVKAINTTV